MNENEKDDNRSFWRGLAVGLASSCAILLVVFGSVKIYQTYRVYGKLASGNSAETESVANEKTTEKLGVLENTIKQYFWQDVDESTLEEGVYKGLLESLDDPYSVYYTHDELVQLQQQTEGIYYGIGAYISQDNEMGYVRVSKIIKNTPAEASGLQQDDYIYKVDGEDMQGKDSSYVVSKIKGEAGTKVTITVVREGATDPIDIEVERQKIESPTVEYQMLDNDMAYIQITEFDLVTTDQFEQAYKQAQADGMKGLILDLRSNPGGNLSTVCDIARMILPKGLIVYTEDKYGKREEYTCDGDTPISIPLVVLVNENTASAAEIFTGAVKDYGIGTIVGTTTFGKGIVQNTFQFSDGSVVKLTIAHYYTPLGNDIHKVGITPDVEVELPDDATSDVQLEKALEVVKGLESAE